MTSYRSKYTTDTDQEDLEWSPEGPVSDRFTTEMETNHRELFDDLKMAHNGKLDHREAPWNTEDHRKLHHTSEDESRYEYRLDPDSAAGRIFESFSDAKSDAVYEDIESAAYRVVDAMSKPADKALTQFRDQDPNAPFRDSIPSMAEDTARRIASFHEDASIALIHGDDEGFVEALTQLQNLSTDAHLMESITDFRPSFIEALQESNPELAQELRVVKSQDGNDPSPSWMDSEHGAPSTDAIYDTINNPGAPDHDDTGHASARYRRDVIPELVEHISHPVNAQIDSFRHEEHATHPAHVPMLVYLSDRLSSIESITEYGLGQRDKDIYNQSFENLIKLQGEVTLARSGEIPQEGLARRHQVQRREPEAPRNSQGSSPEEHG